MRQFFLHYYYYYIKQYLLLRLTLIASFSTFLTFENEVLTIKNRKKKL